MNTNQFRSLDIDRININEYYEVEYWSKEFGLHPEVFKSLVRESGITSAEVFREYLHRNFAESAA